MSSTAKKTDPKLWEKVKDQITKGDKGGKPGQWSARKAQLAAHEYQKQGGGYEGGKSKDNHLERWTEQEWDTKSGKQSGETGERYLPKEAREKLTDKEYARSTQKKRADTRRGRQHSRQPEDVARKAASARTPSLDAMTKNELMQRAVKRDISGRSRMRKNELITALKKAGEK
ncbi:Rho termination factor N-terminal domain-containing protein [Pseudomonas matsuisoli]|uniref:Rho termination factor-like N-terminal domain-containing protein n=1 Tax=Pseudomonas matsuisoli TaxID=1515666 RepID=A0A917PX05_9PSED|nr:Rho termination factor N-terminal domain-containing protein [Pseudomonas matsuisoli]GGJ97899.1 hypothetical protein GCM10009304_24710 [Pseudomonas matsuisoli]